MIRGRPKYDSILEVRQLNESTGKFHQGTSGVSSNAVSLLNTQPLRSTFYFISLTKSLATSDYIVSCIK